MSTERIIPARAGFTGPRHTNFSEAQDHPRSRGVYVRPASRMATEVGSSPLARGLRSGQVGVGGGVRIIPARAGFTSMRRASQRS